MLVLVRETEWHVTLVRRAKAYAHKCCLAPSINRSHHSDAIFAYSCLSSKERRQQMRLSRSASSCDMCRYRGTFMQELVAVKLTYLPELTRQAVSLHVDILNRPAILQRNDMLKASFFPCALALT